MTPTFTTRPLFFPPRELSLSLSLSWREQNSQEHSMAKSKRAHQSGCFSGILRRVLCTGSLPTHPSDQIAESAKATPELAPKKHVKTLGERRRTEEDHDAESRATATPGIVARLMGLDSMPNIGWDQRKLTTHGSLLGRSRSMNSLEYLLQFERMQASASCKARTSSFREVPTFLHPQRNPDFTVRCAGSETEGGGLSRQRKTEVGYGGEVKQRKAERRIRGEGRFRMESNQGKNRKGSKGKKVEHLRGVNGKFRLKAMNNCDGLPMKNRGVYRKPNDLSKPKHHHHPIKPITKKELSVNAKSEKKKKSDRPFDKVVPECNSDSDQPPLSEHDSGAISMTVMRRRGKQKRPSSPELAKSELPFPNRVLTSNIDEDYEPGAPTKNRDEEDQMRVSYPGLEVRYYIELLSEICTLTDEDVKKTNWVDKQQSMGVGFEDYEEMCAEFGEQIVEQVVGEFVDEHFGIPHEELTS